MEQIDLEILGIARVYSGRKINIPKNVKKALELNNGDEIVFYRDVDGSIKITKNKKYMFELR
ncbi:MAG: hypothetical protein QXH55_05640 [Candidatus Korarchaeota archaeon]|nr:type II toxin-antitoxin system PrlF family antitoxin [Thermoproteota archaeon]